MDLKVNFTYPISYIPYRHQNTRTAYFRGETTVNIREVPADQVIPAFRVADREHPRFKPLDGRPRLMVAYDGKLWLETVDAEYFENRFKSEEFPQNTPFDACKHLRIGYEGGQRVVQWTNEATVRRRNATGPMRDWNDDGGEKVAREIAERAEDMIIVNGTIFVRDYEPIWKVDDGQLCLDITPTDPGEPFSDAYRDGYRYTAAPFWRADRKEEAAAAALAEREDGAEVEAGENVILEVLDDRFVRYADDALAVLHAAHQAMRALHNHLPSLPASGAEAFYALRDAMAAGHGKPSPQLVDAVAMTASIMPEPVPAHREKAEETQRDLAMAIDICAKASARWERRPDDGREWVHLGLPLNSSKQGQYLVREVLTSYEAGRIGRALKANLDDMEAAARSGNARIFAVEIYERAWQKNPNLGAFLVEGAGNEPRIVRAVVKDGDIPAQELASAVQGHLFQAGLMAEAAPEPLRVAP